MSRTTTVTWELPAALVEDVLRGASARGDTVDAFVTDACQEWLARVETHGLEQARRRPLPALPDRCVVELRQLAADRTGIRLSMQLWLLAEARWPVVDLAAPLLGVDPRVIEQKVAAGRARARKAGGALIVRTLPPVPLPPDEYGAAAGDGDAESSVDSARREQLTVILPRHVRDDLQRAAREARVKRPQVVAEALVAHLGRGQDRAGELLKPWTLPELVV